MVTETFGGPPPLPASQRIFARPLLVAAFGLIVGAGVDALALRRPIGLGASAAMLVGLGTVLAAKSRNSRYPSEFKWLVPSGIFAAIAIGWRATPTLGALNLFAYSVIVAVALRLYEGAPLRRWTLADYVWRGGAAAAGIVEGAGRFVRYDASMLRPAAGLRKAKPVVIGVAAAGPILVIFLALFISADAVFAEYVSRVFSLDVEVVRFASRLVSSVLVALVAVGCVRAVRSGFRDDRASVQRPSIPSAAIASALTSIVVLFSTFVLVQIRYLFGGESALDLTNLSYSEYARRGFFEMVAVAVLVVVLVAFALWLAGGGQGRSMGVHLAAGSLVLLTLVVVASAAVRMRLYTDAFGLTELRFFTSVFMGWTAFVLLLLVATAFRGDRAGFALGLLVSGLVFIAALTVANPHAIIASVNVDRHLAGADLDYAYVADLGPDAVPTLVAHASLVESPCILSAELSTAGASDDRSEWGWRSSTVAHMTAATAVASLAVCPP